MEDEVRLTAGEHLIILTVNDGNVSVSSNVTIFIETGPEPEDEPPVAVISSPDDGQNFFVRELIEFRSQGSFDPEGHSLEYLWKIDGYNVSTGSEFSIYLKEGVHSVSLVVSDLNMSVTDSITVIVTNRAPVVLVFLNGTLLPDVEAIIVVENDTLIFDASGSSDPEGGGLTYTWTLDEEFLGSSPQIILELERGYHQLKLTIKDEDGRSTTIIKALNCIKPSNAVDDAGGTDEADSKRAPLALYIIPSILIIIFLIIAIVFFTLSRKDTDVYFEE
jgi:PKD repeat protein